MHGLATIIMHAANATTLHLVCHNYELVESYNIIQFM